MFENFFTYSCVSENFQVFFFNFFPNTQLHFLSREGFCPPLGANFLLRLPLLFKGHNGIGFLQLVFKNSFEDQIFQMQIVFDQKRVWIYKYKVVTKANDVIMNKSRMRTLDTREFSKRVRMISRSAVCVQRDRHR